MVARAWVLVLLVLVVVFFASAAPAPACGNAMGEGSFRYVPSASERAERWLHAQPAELSLLLVLLCGTLCGLGVVRLGRGTEVAAPARLRTPALEALVQEVAAALGQAHVPQQPPPALPKRPSVAPSDPGPTLQPTTASAAPSAPGRYLIVGPTADAGSASTVEASDRTLTSPGAEALAAPALASAER